MDSFAIMASDPLTDLRIRLLRQGYEPIPVVSPDAPGPSPGKRPSLQGWSTIEIGETVIRGWRSDSQRLCPGTGLRCGLLRAVDIDVLDPSLAEQVHTLAVKLLGATPLRRVGKAPKLLLCYRVTEAQPKAETFLFRLPDGSAAQVEVLGQGQQFVAYGVHPDTGRDYEWPELGPDVVTLPELPLLDQLAEKAFLGAAEALIRASGGRTPKEIEAEEMGRQNQSTSPRPVQQPRAQLSRGDFFRQVNTEALSRIEVWFKRLFPAAHWQPNAATPPGAWRVHSADLGRALEEDISVHPEKGGYDFGTEKPVTPIDLVMEHGGVPDAIQAAQLLCQWMSIAPEDLGWRLSRQANETAPGGGEGATSSNEDRSSRLGVPCPALQLLDPRGWVIQPSPRKWIVLDWVPRGVVTGLYGDGGVGKSITAMQLLSSVALSLPWLGLTVAPGRALGIFCEDDETELQRRQWSINHALGVDASRLENLRYLARLGHDNALITFDGSDVGTPTPFAAALDELCGEFRPDLLVLDTIADLFPANENDRAKVRQFVQTILGGLARRHGCAVLALGHPSVTGMNNGTGQSGSTAWNNTFRSRFYLTREEGEQADPNGRLLTRKKANYAARDAETRLQWYEGTFRVVSNSEKQAGDVSWVQISAIFDEIERAWNERRPWSHRPEARRNGRMLQVWARATLGIPEKRLTALLSEWLMHAFLAVEQVDRHSKKQGLRVLKRLHPQAWP